MKGISYEYYSAKSDRSHKYLFPVVSEFLRNVPEASKVLDLGCGNGTFLALFLKRGWELFGIDLSPTGIGFARQTFPSIRFFLADASAPAGIEELGQFDVILSVEVIEHLYDPKAFLRNAYAMLKSGSILIITTPYHGYFKNLMLAATGKLDDHFTVLWDHGHIKFWSYKTLRLALNEAGFVNVEFQGAGRIPWLWKSMVVKATKP